MVLQEILLLRAKVCILRAAVERYIMVKFGIRIPYWSRLNRRYSLPLYEEKFVSLYFISREIIYAFVDH